MTRPGHGTLPANAEGVGGRLLTGDCLDVMPTLAAASVDAVVTDPPYGLGFMGKAWDHGAPGVPFWEAMLRVTAPGGYLLAFGGTRTYHRMTVAIEDAGWIIRDCLVWGYATGFPKSKALLKPAWEPIVMARKPGPLRELAIDACRIGYVSETERAEVNARTGPNSRHRPQVGGGTTGSMSALGERHVADVTHPAGRWPANVLLTDPIFDGDTEGVVGGGDTQSPNEARPLFRGATTGSGMGYGGSDAGSVGSTYSDQGTYSRFFLIPKADRAEREPLVPSAIPERVVSVWGGDEDDLTPGKKSTIARRNTHPTVKPLDLMRHLVRLVTPTRVPCLVCHACGTVVEYPHGKEHSITNAVYTVRGSDRDGPSDASPVLRQEVRDEVHRAAQGELPWMDHEPEGLHPGAQHGASDGEPRGLRHAAPPSDGGDAGAAAAAERSRGSHQRDQERQPAGKPASAGEARSRQPAQAAEEAHRLPALQLDDPHLGSCPACGGSLTAAERVGRVLDPFLGSGTTAIAAEMEGFGWIGIEREPEYVAISEARLQGVQRGFGLEVPA